MPLQNSKCKAGDKKQVPYLGPINIRRHHTNLVALVTWNLEIVCCKQFPFEISKGFMLSVRIQQHYVMKHPVPTAAMHVSVML
jgi:hypothetical protein